MTSLTAVARHLGFIRESVGPNAGAWVEALQRFCGGKAGDSWCADFVCFVLDVAYRGHSPLPRSGSTRMLLDAARLRGLVVKAALPDDLFFYTHTDGTPHHVGIVTMANPLTGIAGNTSEDGTSSNGTGVFEHTLSMTNIVFVRLPLV